MVWSDIRRRSKAMIKRLPVTFFACGTFCFAAPDSPEVTPAPANLAPLAMIEGSGEHVQRITDGLTGPEGEWVPETPNNTLWGLIGYGKPLETFWFRHVNFAKGGPSDFGPARGQTATGESGNEFSRT